jgi:hypothetical protein
MKSLRPAVAPIPIEQEVDEAMLAEWNFIGGIGTVGSDAHRRLAFTYLRFFDQQT